jgi:polynucleotide 5'-kinase involved in rRNA processing
MLPMLVGAARLVGRARTAGYPSIVYDTSGLIDPDQGGLALKYAKVDLLQPNALVAFQIDRELEPLLHGLHLSKRTRVLPMRPSQATVERDILRRQSYRQKSYKDYFQNAKRVVLDWQQYATLLAPRFALHRLVSLEDRQGFSLGLGIVMDIDRTKRQLDLLTPLADLSAVRTIFLSDLLVSPETFKDQHIT